MHDQRMPKQPFPSLPGGIDLIVKAYDDKYRAKGLTPLLKGKLKAKFVGQELANILRKWLSFPDEETGATLLGIMDDCLIDDEDYLIVMDNKTRGFAFKEEMDKKLLDIYTFQLEAYAFLLARKGYKVRDFGYLVYYIPKQSDEITDGIKFDASVKKIALNPDRVLKVFHEAVKVARQAHPPAEHNECGMCAWIKALSVM